MTSLFASDVLYVKPCWGIFRHKDVRTVSAYPSESAAIRHAMNDKDRVTVVVLNAEGKVVERWTREPLS